MLRNIPFIKKFFNRIRKSFDYENNIEKAQFVFINWIRLILIIAILTAVYNKNWEVLFVSIMTFLLTFLPYLFELSYKINLPAEFEIATVVFLFSAIFLGEVNKYYTIFWWWDLVLHAGSALALGFFGFTVLYVLYRGNKIFARPSTIAIFAFSFALALGALWEIFEFSMDQLFGFSMQKSGLLDTMWDLIVDSVGALIASLIGYLYIKKNEFFFFGRVMKRFIKQNPHLFMVKK